MIPTPHPEQFLYATTTLLDAVLVNGHGELAYVTQTSGSLTTLFRLDTLNGGLKRVSTIKWAHGSSRPFVTVYDVKYGTIIRQYEAPKNQTTWSKSTIPFGTSIYSQLAVAPDGAILDASIMMQKHASRPWPRMGKRPPCAIEYEIRLFRNALLSEDDEVVLSAILLVTKLDDWRNVQSADSVRALESLCSLRLLSADPL